MPSPRSCRLLLNARAAQDPLLREQVDALRETGHEIEVRLSWEPGDVAREAKAAVEAGVAMVVACGGDGTIHEVLQGLGTHDAGDILVGALPYGTGNDFVRSIYSEEIAEAQGHLILGDLLTSTLTQDVDVWRMNDEFFMNAVSLGYGADATDSTPGFVKDIFGHAGYTAWGMLTLNMLEAFPFTLTTDTHKIEGDGWLIVVGNGRFVGGGFEACPKAKIDDGLIDVTVVPRMGAIQTLKAVKMLLAGGEHPDHDKIITAQSTSLTIDLHRPMSLNADGERVEAETVRFERRARAVRWALPRTFA